MDRTWAPTSDSVHASPPSNPSTITHYVIQVTKKNRAILLAGKLPGRWQGSGEGPSPEGIARPEKWGEWPENDEHKKTVKQIKTYIHYSYN